MPGRDIVSTAIAGPLDWARFEDLVYAVLVADDLPRLRKIGGFADGGVDAQEEVFYNGERGVPTIVQISSSTAQRQKVRGTIAKLRANGIVCNHLIFVTRHPITSSIRTALVDEAAKDSVTLDIRDDQYLIAQLSKPGSPIFPRFFGTVQDQISALLGRPDPLQIASTPQKHALLATLGAYVLSPRARLTRGTLFQKTVLAALAAAGGRAHMEQLVKVVASLLPGEVINEGRLTEVIRELKQQGACVWQGQDIVCDTEVLSQFVAATRAAENGYRALTDHILKECQKRTRLADAEIGYLERNIRRALLEALRSTGPLTDAAESVIVTNTLDPRAIAKDLPLEVAQSALAAFSAFVQSSENAKLLAPLVRAYAALAIYNLDPIGRRWQQSVLSRSTVALDTDAVLALLVEEIPEHRPLLIAVTALQEQGVRIVIARHVLEEVVLHVQHADRTFRRFADSLLRLPQGAVNDQVWHAVVRGFYYATMNGFKGSPGTYWKKYYDSARPAQFIRHILQQRVKKMEEGDLSNIPTEWEGDCPELERAALELKERNRMKAEFRDVENMERRVRADVLMVLHMAAVNDPTLGASARGYLASEDRAFAVIQAQPIWGGRSKVLIATRSVPHLASFVCGVDLTDDDFVLLLFHPVIAAAAGYMANAITALASLGVDLKNVPLTRLEWDLAHGLNEQIHHFHAAVASTAPDAEDQAAHAALATLKAAKAAGYLLAGPVEKLAASYDLLVNSVESERRKREEIEEKMRALIVAARGRAGRGRRRFNRVLRELGIELELSEGPAEREQTYPDPEEPTSEP